MFFVCAIWCLNQTVSHLVLTVNVSWTSQFHTQCMTWRIHTLCRRAVYRLNLFVLWGTHSLLSPGCSFYRAVSVNLVKWKEIEWHIIISFSQVFFSLSQLSPVHQLGSTLLPKDSASSCLAPTVLRKIQKKLQPPCVMKRWLTSPSINRSNRTILHEYLSIVLRGTAEGFRSFPPLGHPCAGRWAPKWSWGTTLQGVWLYGVQGSRPWEGALKGHAR